MAESTFVRVEIGLDGGQILSTLVTTESADALERRITEAGANVDVFRRADPPASGPTMMVRSPYACVGCHQQ